MQAGESDYTDGQKVCQVVVGNIAKVLVGKEGAAEMALLALLCEGHVLIEDVPGVGKTSLAQAMAKSVGCSFKRIQFTPDILPSDITGFSMFNPKTNEFEYRPGLVMSSFILADEINRTSPKTQASLLEVMQESQVTVDGITHSVGEPFMVIATQNPLEYVGTYPLPEAQMDRFLLRISLGYPAREEEGGILRRFKESDPLDELTPVIQAKHILALQQLVRGIRVEETLYEYITDVVRATREHPDIELGASPRGSLALFRAAQARALSRGRGYMLPDDVKAMAEPVLAHRLILRQEARLRRVRQYDVISEILSRISIAEVVRGYNA
ncbi:MAG: MoxR family ATPase [Oscillospiraceae bacterium]|jgi:MoxR-like ATPase|nr:MoxR family ATPase [Oscillospiraceae bacterium]